MNAKATATLKMLRKMADSADNDKESAALNRIIDAVIETPSPAGVVKAIATEENAPAMLKLVAATFAIENGL